MSSGRINTNGKLDSWRSNPNREILPGEPNYDKHVESFKKKISKRHKNKNQFAKFIVVKTKWKGAINNNIDNVSHILKISKYKDQSLRSVTEKDPIFIENFIKDSGYSISEKVINELRELIKKAKNHSKSI